MIVAFASLDPEPLQAAPQGDHRLGVPAPGAGRRHTALVQGFGHRVADEIPARSSSAIVPAMLRANASACV